MLRFWASGTSGNVDQATVFDVDVHDLQRLKPEQAVDVLRLLLWAEANAVGIAKNLINVPTSINVADGGIDAEVHYAQPVGGQGIIKLGITRYQVKTGKFSLKGGASNIRSGRGAEMNSLD